MTNKGFSLIETVFALCILLVVAAGVLPLGIVATKTTENQGHLVARTTEYAQDKMEQLLALSYGNSTSDTRVFPTAETGGTGLTVGGGGAGYVDYLDINGQLVAAGDAAWFYRRQWQVQQVAGRTNLKLITVTASVRVPALGGIGAAPTSTLAVLKTSPL